jgi:hypothetical protein
MLKLETDEKGGGLGTGSCMILYLKRSHPTQVWTKLPLKGSMAASPPRKAVQIGE